MNKKLLKTVFTALFAALCCAATFIYIPSPASNGYLNMGDCFVILSGWLLGPVYGFIAAGMGSAISDLALGYAIYAPATFIIKGLMALASCFIFTSLSKAFSKKNIFPKIISSLSAEVIMISGYYLYDSLITQNFVSSLAGVPGNAVQGLFGIVVSILIMSILEKTGLKNKFSV
ncbi:MAG: ECF transporter S component [Clostridia bacterium]|nr:ECF transporter S component [Clostridia bacterium]